MSSLVISMKSIILTFILSFSGICVFAQRQVFVCMGTGAYRYHYYKDCSGQNNCKATIKKMSLEEAKRIPNIRGLCMKCEKKSLITKIELPEAENFMTKTQEETDSCYTCMLEKKARK